MSNFFTSPPSDEHDLKSWVMWIVLLFVGLVASCSFFYVNNQEILSTSQTNIAISSVDSQVNKMASSAILATHGHDNAVSEMLEIRNFLRNNLLMLQNGGYINQSSPARVISLSGNGQLSRLNSSLDEFDKAVQPMASSAERLRAISTAEKRLSEISRELEVVSNQIGQSQGLSSPSWSRVLSPLRQDMTRREISNLPLIFSPPQASSNIASQWVNLFDRRASETESLPALASRDNNLSPKDVDLINKFVTLINEISNHTKTLQRYNELRLTVNQSSSKIQQLSDDMLQASASLVAYGQQIKPNPILNYLIIASLVVTLIGFFGSVRAFWNLGSRYWYSFQAGHKNATISSSVESLTRDLKKIVSKESGQRKVSDSPDSPIFALSSLVNQMISQLEITESLLDESTSVTSDFVNNLKNVSEDFKANQSSNLDVMRSVHINTIHFSQHLLRLVDKLKNVEGLGDNSWDMANKGSAISQETLWKIESLRENTQNTSKRVKRLGESAQSINSSVDVIKDMSKKFKVLAVNIAIEAASHGEEGKNYTVLARELERLAQITDQTLKDIDIQIDAIHNDSKETVSSMEKNTSDVVQCTKLSVEVGSVFKEIEKISKKTSDEIQSTISEFTETADGIAQESAQVDVLVQSGVKQSQSGEGIDNTLQALQGTLNKVKSWFSGNKRDF